MGFVDDMRVIGAEARDKAGNAAGVARLRLELSDLGRRRSSLMAQLGEAVYERTHNDPEARELDEPLYTAIDALDSKRMEVMEALGSLSGTSVRGQEREPKDDQASRQAGSQSRLRCPGCGAAVEEGDLFCMECGAKLEGIVAQVDVEPQDLQPGRICPQCGAQVEEGDLFCLECGTRLEAPVSGTEPQAAEVAAAVVDVPQDTDVASDEPSSALQDTWQGTEVRQAAGAQEGANGEELQDTLVVKRPDTGAFCVACGRQLKPADVFCGWCGTRVLRD